jgi:hypothetical protein
MRAIPAITLVIAGVALASPGGAQTRSGHPSINRPDSGRTTTGAAPSSPGQAPNGHRQPKAADSPSDAPGITPFDREIDRNLQICRNC